jgi:hypothetical protein
MNDLDEFAEIAMAIFVALPLLVWVLTRMERTLHNPVSQNRNHRPTRPPGGSPSDESPTDSLE